MTKRHEARNLVEYIAAQEEWEDVCIEWPYATLRDTPYIRWFGKLIPVAGAFYEVLFKRLPINLSFQLLCRNSNCVNPSHMLASDSPATYAMRRVKDVVEAIRRTLSRWTRRVWSGFWSDWEASQESPVRIYTPDEVKELNRERGLC
jgi:hypothetical protein